MSNLSSFDLNLLRVLDALLRERSTVRAGHRVGLSQPAVSAALGRLRHALGDRLLVRQGRGLVPTRFADALELPLRAALRNLEQVLRGPVFFDPAGVTMDFRISGTDFFTTMLVPKLTAQLRQSAPGVRLQFVDLVPDNYIDTIEHHNVDLAIIPRQGLPGWLRSASLFRADFVVTARAGHPALRAAGLAPGDVIPLDLFCRLDHVLCSPEGRFHGLADAALARVGRSRRVVLSVPVFEGVIQTVAATDLLGLLPRDLVERRAAGMGLALYRPPVTLSLPELCMVWHLRQDDDPAHRWMRGLVRAILAPLDHGEAAPHSVP